MYLKYFQFDREPFNITPDPEFLYLSTVHKEALASIIYGVEQRKGFILVVGEIGVGKTTIIRSYLTGIDPEKLTAIYILNPMLSFSNLVRQLCRELGLSLTANTFDMLNELQDYLLQQFKKGKNVVLIIDEAQNMPVDTLENLRMLSNIETSKEKLIQIIFSAQPEFEKTLNLPELRQLKQRISVRAVISPLAPVAGVAYIHSRLSKATTIESAPFTAGALKNIVSIAHGIPRIINILCDNCLINAYGYGQKQVSCAIVDEVAHEYGIRRYPLYKPLFTVSMLLLIVVAGLSLYLLPKGSPSEPAPVPVPAVASAPAPPERAAPEGRRYLEKIVQKGDTLARLVTEVYGRADRGKMALVRKANPGITDENLIVEGRRLRFPLDKAP